MEKIETVREQIMEMIIESDIEDSFKEQLLDFSSKINDIKNIDTKIDVLIDCMPLEDIKIFLEYATIILQKYQIFKGQIYDYKKINNIKHIDNESLVVIDDFEEFEDSIISSRYNTNNFFSNIRQKRCLLLMTCTNNIKNYYNDYFNIQKINPDLCIHIKHEEYSTTKIYNKLINEYKNNNIIYKIEKDKMYKIIDEVVNSNICNSYTCASFLYDYSIKRKIIENKDKVTIDLFNKLVKNEKEKNSIQKLVGLKSVKEEIETLKNYLQFKNKTSKALDKMYLNMFFLGNPGTGKTTVARKLANYLYDLGYIKENKVVEIVPNDLMANYVGQTKDQTRKFLKQAKGGILFIDEAYMLADVVYADGFSSYMKEAISELLKYLENPENVVIFAGYKDGMHKVYDANPGIKSRIFKEIEFPDYSKEELYQILKNNLEQIDLKIDYKIKKELLKYITNEKEKTNFGNARSMEQLAQTLVTNHANRKLKKENFIITIEDLPTIKNETTGLGFKGGI